MKKTGKKRVTNFVRDMTKYVTKRKKSQQSRRDKWMEIVKKANNDKLI
jgi:hypothetical protein